MTQSRREFIQSAALTALAPASLLAAEVNRKGMPQRTLGRTGAQVSILAFGCGSRFLMYKQEDEALAALNLALERGITYLDTAADYQDGLSEERVGKVLKHRGKNGADPVWVATKIPQRNGDEAMRTIEASLKRLQMERIDLIHIHSLAGADDLAKIEAPDGVLKRLYQLRDQKVTRAIGITSHTDPHVLKAALEHNDFDCTQMALNAARAGMAKPDGGFGMTRLQQSFETVALPVARQKNMGVIAMKIFAQDGLVDKAPVEKLIRYSLSLPVSAVVIGMPKVELIEQNVAFAKDFQKLGKGEMRDLSDRLAADHKAELDRLLADHVDA
jgi:predicted aldo/keto reductase-like oxidoreductase